IMNTIQLRIGLTCLFGAAIGTLLAFQFNQYFWWAGVLIGGAVGYLSYEFGRVVNACRTVWQENYLQEICRKCKADLIESLLRLWALVLCVTVGFTWILPPFFIIQAFMKVPRAGSSP